MSSQRKMGSQPAQRLGRLGDEFRQLGAQIQRQIRRVLIRRAYNYRDWVTAQTYRHPELEGVPGVVEQVETDFPFYLVRFPSKGESYWFPEPELTRTQPPAGEQWGGPMPGMEPGAMPGAEPGAMPGAQPGAMPGTPQGGMPRREQGAPSGIQPPPAPRRQQGALPGAQQGPGAQPGAQPWAEQGATGAQPGARPGGPGAEPGTPPESEEEPRE